ELRARAAEAQAAELERAARAARRAAPAAPIAPSTTTLAFVRLRRARRVAGLLLLAAVAVAGVQLWLMATTGIALGAWFVLGGCALAALVSVRLQGRIAERSRALATQLPAAAPVRRTSPTLIDAELPQEKASREWTPVPIPKPLYIERGEAPRVPVTPPVSPEELLRAAHEEAQRALAAAHAEPEVVLFRRRGEAASASPAAAAGTAPTAPERPAASRFASMGVLSDVDTAMPDLDEVLRRRRSG
ncbi:MAG: hypothetical protein EAS51_11065, partial [Microbacteriaceae bacterium]